MIKNKDGVRNSHTSHGEVMISLDGKGRENEGRVIGAALCYGGNYKLMFDTDDSDYHHFFAGINEENSAYHLKKGETFATPPLALTYSEEGLGGASRNFHKWGARLSPGSRQHSKKDSSQQLGRRLFRHQRGGNEADDDRYRRHGRRALCYGRTAGSA